MASPTSTAAIRISLAVMVELHKPDTGNGQEGGCRHDRQDRDEASCRIWEGDNWPRTRASAYSVRSFGWRGEVAVFNGRDGEWRGRIDGIGKGWASITLLPRPVRNGPNRIWIAFAPIKRARIDFVAQKATELGAARLMPVLTRRRLSTGSTPTGWRQMRSKHRSTDRLTVPVVDAPVKLDRLLDEWPGDRPGDETGR